LATPEPVTKLEATVVEPKPVAEPALMPVNPISEMDRKLAALAEIADGFSKLLEGN